MPDFMDVVAAPRPVGATAGSNSTSFSPTGLQWGEWAGGLYPMGREPVSERQNEPIRRAEYAAYLIKQAQLARQSRMAKKASTSAADAPVSAMSWWERLQRNKQYGALGSFDDATISRLSQYENINRYLQGVQGALMSRDIQGNLTGGA